MSAGGVASAIVLGFTRWFLNCFHLRPQNQKPSRKSRNNSSLDKRLRTVGGGCGRQRPAVADVEGIDRIEDLTQARVSLQLQ